LVVNQYLTFMATLYSIFYPTFDILIWQICEIPPIANLLVSISFAFVFLRKAQQQWLLSNSHTNSEGLNLSFRDIFIPSGINWASMFEPPSLPEEDRRRIDSNVIQRRFLELCELKWEKLFQKSTGLAWEWLRVYSQRCRQYRGWEDISGLLESMIGNWYRYPRVTFLACWSGFVDLRRWMWRFFNTSESTKPVATHLCSLFSLLILARSFCRSG
jgi:hypothetical protein